MGGRYGAKERICGLRARVLAAALAGCLALVISGCGGRTNELAAVGSSPTTGPVATAIDTATATATAEPNPLVSGAPNGVIPAPGEAGQQYPPPIPPSTACPPSGINVLVWGRDSAMGLRTAKLRAFNCSSANLTLTGYAGLRVLDDSGAVLPVAIAHGVISPSITDPQPVEVFLKPGQSAMAVLSWRALTEQSGAVINAPAVRIATLKGADPQDVPLEVDLGTTGKIAIGVWQRYSEA